MIFLADLTGSGISSGHGFSMESLGRSGHLIPQSSFPSYQSQFVRKPFFKCEQCGKTFTCPKTKKEHIDAVHENVTYPCVCGKVYKYPRNIRRHKKECSIFKASTGSYLP